MTDFQVQKDIVRQFHGELAAARTDDMSRVLSRWLTPDHLWRGMHPWNEISGPHALAEAFWLPLQASFSHLDRRMDVFFAGHNAIAGVGGTWVVSMGHLAGLFDAPWLGIRPTGKLTLMRYAEFMRVEGTRIAETAMFIDIPHLMIQAGQSPFPTQTAAHLVQPGPATHDGLLYGRQPEDEGVRTLAAIERMIASLGRWQSGLPLEHELSLDWHPDMLWWGPAGIGATYTIGRYARQHAGPFRSAFSTRSETRHLCRLAEGHYGGFFGWPNFTACLDGTFTGLPPTGKRGEFRVVDVYRRVGGKLAENWVFIDLLHFWKGQGIDLLARARAGEDARVSEDCRTP